MMFLFVALLATAPAAAPAPASKPAVINKDTRPDLFSDEPPPRPGVMPEATEAPRETAAGFWLGMLFRTMLVLGVVVLLAYLILNKGLTRLMKMTGVKQGKNLVLLERLPLDQKHALFLIEVEGRRLVVGTGEHTTTLVADLSDGERQKNEISAAPAMTVSSQTFSDNKGTG